MKYSYLGNIAGLENNPDKVPGYPVVLKKLHGAGSSNVYKVETYNDLVKILKRLNRPRNYLRYTLKKFLKKPFLKIDLYKSIIMKIFTQVHMYYKNI